MKRSLLLLLVLASLSSCDKYECWSCVTGTTTTYSTGQQETESSTANYCNETAMRIRQIEQEGTRTFTTETGLATATTTMKTSCSRQ